MKPTSEMTDQELNEAIALIKDLRLKMNDCDHFQWQVRGQIKDAPPNFCSSWELAGGLFDELRQKVRKPQLFYDNSRVTYFCMYILDGNGIAFYSESPTRAIAEAWYEINKA